MKRLNLMSWNILLAAVFLSGSMFITATRVQPEGVRASTPLSESVVQTSAPQEGAIAPDFSLTALDGTTVQLSAFRGHVVLINIWATWCPPCRSEMPMIQVTYDQYRERGFTVLAVNLREDPHTVAAYMQQAKLTFPALLDSDGALSTIYRSNVMPSSFFVDKTGVIRAVYRGPLSRGVLSGTVESLLAEEP